MAFLQLLQDFFDEHGLADPAFGVVFAVFGSEVLTVALDDVENVTGKLFKFFSGWLVGRGGDAL